VDVANNNITSKISEGFIVQDTILKNRSSLEEMAIVGKLLFHPVEADFYGFLFFSPQIYIIIVYITCGYNLTLM
jgi:hypothetical protein